MDTQRQKIVAVSYGWVTALALLMACDHDY